MSTTFVSIWLGSLAGIATYYLIENLYYELKSRYHTRQYNQFIEELEEEWDLDL